MAVPVNASNLATNLVDGQTITAAADNARDAAINALEAEMLAYPLAAVLEGTQRTASFTFAAADGGLVVPVSVSTAANATIPPSSSVSWRVGQILAIRQVSTAAVTFLAGAGVSLVCFGKTAPFSTGGVNAVVYARRIQGTETWLLDGNLA